MNDEYYYEIKDISHKKLKLIKVCGDFNEDLQDEEKYGLAHPASDGARFMEIGNSVFMQYRRLEDGSFEPLEKKNVDMIVANNLKTQGAGFGTDTNVVTIIMADETWQLPIMSKDEVANAIFDSILGK